MSKQSIFTVQERKDLWKYLIFILCFSLLGSFTIVWVAFDNYHRAVVQKPLSEPKASANIPELFRAYPPNEPQYLSNTIVEGAFLNYQELLKKLSVEFLHSLDSLEAVRNFWYGSDAQVLLSVDDNVMEYSAIPSHDKIGWDNEIITGSGHGYDHDPELSFQIEPSKGLLNKKVQLKASMNVVFPKYSSDRKHFYNVSSTLNRDMSFFVVSPLVIDYFKEYKAYIDDQDLHRRKPTNLLSGIIATAVSIGLIAAIVIAIKKVS